MKLTLTIHADNEFTRSVVAKTGCIIMDTPYGLRVQELSDGRGAFTITMLLAELVKNEVAFTAVFEED